MDDTEPNTDGKFVVWLTNLEGRWRVVLYELETGVTKEISSPDHPARLPKIWNGVVTWQEWINEGWETVSRAI